ncbi:ABC transporter permease [Magnetococcales bacterium HHB-1]
MITPIKTLAFREIIRFFRQPHRVAGSLAQPLIFWIFLGSGFSASFQAPGLKGVNYLEYFFPGVILMLTLFSSIFATITIIEDRNQGLLQEVLVAPISRVAIVFGKVLGAMGVALIQAAPLLIAIPFLGFEISFFSYLLILIGLILAALGFTALGFLIAWKMESTSGYHAIMSIFLMPMWMLSGAIFPLDGAPGWLWSIMIINPASHALHLVRLPLYHEPSTLLFDATYITALIISALWAAGSLLWALKRVRQIEKGV